MHGSRGGTVPVGCVAMTITGGYDRVAAWPLPSDDVKDASANGGRERRAGTGLQVACTGAHEVGRPGLDRQGSSRSVAVNARFGPPPHRKC